MILQAELDRMNNENQRLRSLLNQVNNNYQVLNMHVASLMQRRQNQNSESGEEHNKVINFLTLLLHTLFNFRCIIQ